MELRWDNVSIDVTAPDGKPKRILSSVSGVAKPGELVALLGPSGAGKTTLLSALAGRAKLAAGDIALDAKSAKGVSTKRKGSIALVTQEDTLFTGLTVFQTLWYAAAVRLPSHLTQEERMERVKESIKRLGLAKVAHTKVGTVMNRGLSGGERKRLNVAQELLTDPPVLLADEPTSGLDHVAALALADVFAEIAAAGRTVVATVHQPSSRLFRRFTTCCILAEGRLVFFGPASTVAAYMEAPPVSRPCPAHYNIADHMLEVVQETDPIALEAAWAAAPKRSGGAIDFGAFCELHEDAAEDDLGATPKVTAEDGDEGRASGTDADAAPDSKAEPGPAADAAAAEGEPASGEKVKVLVLPGPAAGSPEAAKGAGAERAVVMGASAAVRDAEKALDTARPVSAAPPACIRGCGRDERWPTTWCQQLFALTSRAFRTSSGSTLTWLMSVQHLCLCVIGSIIWWQLPREAGTVRDRTGALFFYVIYIGFTSLFGALTTFPAERAVLRRERQAGAFRLSAYYTAKCLADIPVACIYPICVGTVVYWTVGLRADAGAFFTNIAMLVTVGQVAQAIGVCVSATVLDFMRSITVASVLMLGFMLASGFYSTEIPAALGWIKFLGFPSYGFAIAVLNEFPANEPMPCGADGEGFAGLACPVDAASIRASINPPVMDIGSCFAVLAAMFVLFRVSGYVALRVNA